MTVNDTLITIKQRRSIRDFAARQIKDEEIRAILEAAQYAPHAGDEAWHFTAVQNRGLLIKLNNAAKEAARTSDIEFLRKLGNDADYDCLYGAPALILISGDSRSPVPLDADCAAANQNILLAAESLGLGSCWIYFVLMAFQSPHGPELIMELKIPEGYRPYCSAAVGYKKQAPPAAPPRKPNLVTIIK